MDFAIDVTTDAALLAELNRPVQVLHNSLYPAEFKPFDHAEIEQAFERIFREQDAHAFVARAEEQFIGYVLCMVLERSANAFQHARRILVVDQIAVKQGYRRRGVASKLLDRALELANEVDITEIEIEHWAENEAAGEFFRREGFQYFKHRMKKIIR